MHRYNIILSQVDFFLIENNKSQIISGLFFSLRMSKAMDMHTGSVYTIYLPKWYVEHLSP